MEATWRNIPNLSDEESRLGKFAATESRLAARSTCREGGVVSYRLMIAGFLFGSVGLAVMMVAQYGDLYT